MLTSILNPLLSDLSLFLYPRPILGCFVHDLSHCFDFHLFELIAGAYSMKQYNGLLGFTPLDCFCESIVEQIKVHRMFASMCQHCL